MLNKEIPTGFKEIDRLLGFNRGMIYVIGGVIGAGKSSFIIQSAVNQSKAGFKPVLFSMDEPEELIINRAVSMEEKITLTRIEKGLLSAEVLLTHLLMCKL